MKRSSKFVTGTIIILLVICSSWGFLVHRTVNQLAVYQLPQKMQPFYYKHLDYIVKNSIRPDERRNSDPTEAPKHFIDLEPFGDSAAWKMPLTWSEAVKKYSRDTLVKYGYVPYWVIEIKNRLTNAFRQRNVDSILFYSADLGHYIADANVPLHTSVNYDGQLTGQRGMHALWESVVPELSMERWNLAGKKSAKYLKHPEQAIWEAVRYAHSLLPEVFVAEKEVSRLFTQVTKYRIEKRNNREVKYYSNEFIKDYGQRLQQSINDQLLRSANLIADFWYTAWVDGGKPDLKKLLLQFSDNDNKALKKEVKAYRQSFLLRYNFLISKREAVGDPANH